ncbi:MAG: acyltransferase [Planctomycetes bacterium]|nr:acyltransferase [Planctomycetota bacterium]
MTQPDTADWKRTTFLDGLRGLAAFYVLVGHARYLLHEGNPDGFAKHAAEYSTLNKMLFYALSVFRWGHEGVLFFFVLSGFVIHLRYARKVQAEGMNAQFGWPGYVWRRIRRLYPPLLLAIALTWALDSVGTSAGYAIYSGQTPYGQINSEFGRAASGHTPAILLGNLAFLMKIYVPAFGTDGPLWSLMYEWWFYMIFPLFWLLSRRSIALATAVMAAMYVLTRFRAVGELADQIVPMKVPFQVFTMMIIWWFGVLLADIYAGRLRIPFAALAPLTVLVPVGLLCNDRLGQWGGLVVGLGFVGVIASGFTLQRAGFNLAVLNMLKPLGNMSYTLYVCHMPIIAFLSGWLMSRSPGSLLPRHFGWVPVGVVIAVVFSWLAHFVVEKPFTREGKKKTAEAPATTGDA